MNPPVNELLSASDDVKALIGDPIRSYGGGIAPQGTPAPYITWNIVSGVPENYLSERPDMDMIRVQVDCWGPSRAQARQSYLAAVAALELSAHQVSFNDDSQDPETKNWRHSADFVFWQPR